MHITFIIHTLLQLNFLFFYFIINLKRTKIFIKIKDVTENTD